MIVILNAAAGAASTSNDLKSRITDGFSAAQITPEIVVVRSEHISAAAKEVMAGRENTIVVGGGDGTISAVAAELVGRQKILGILPLGTLNHFAQDLGIPLDLAGAIRTIVDGHIVTVDAAEVNGRIFINNSSLGIYPQIVRRREIQQERLGVGKWPAFVWATLVAFHRFPFLRLRIAVEGKTLQRKTAFLFIGNNEYEITGFRLGGRHGLNSGKLWLYLAHRVGRWGAIRLGVRALLGHLSQEKDFEAYCVDEAFIETTRRSVLVATDGEVNRLGSPLRYQSRPDALRVIVPSNSAV